MEGKDPNKKKTRAERGKLSISIVTQLGGNKEDLQLLADVEDNSDSDVEHDTHVDFDAEPIKRDEIKDLLKELEIYKHRPKTEGDETKDVKDKKKKLLVSTNDKGTDKASEEVASTSEEIKSDGKKKRNKYKVQHDEVTSTTKDPLTEYKTHIKAYQPRKYLLVKSGADYYDNQDTVVNEREKMSDVMVAQMEEFAAKLLQDEISVYNKQKEGNKRSDVGWMRTVLTSGTLADKIAALTVLVQESPLHNLSNLDTLIVMAKKKGNREHLQASETLKEIFLTDILPDDRKLKTFSQRPLSSLGVNVGWNKDALDKKLILWYFESKLKEKYSEFVKALQTLCHDTVLATKQKSVNTVYHLLVTKPEQENMLLTLLINKVGDPHYKLASMVSHFLTKLVENHPNMKSVVVREVEQLLFRPNISVRAQYYSICFLNQLRLSHKESELSSKVIKIYFSFFKSFVKKGEVDSKMMSALLSGVNRAYPFAKLNEDFLSEQMEHLYKIVHIVNFNTSIQALMLLFQVMDSSQNTSERYYVALYKKLADPALKTSSKQAIFLNMLFKSMKKDESERRVKAFIKRLLQVCSYQQPQFTCGALILLSEVLKVRPGLLSVAHVEEESDEEEYFVDLPDPDDVSKGDDDKNMAEVSESVTSKSSASSWVHRKNLNHKSDVTCYDPYHRNPQYCHAENACIWELENLSQHFHPTVSLFAKQILKSENVSYSGDPLQDFTLIRFLDRFVYKNPKKQEQSEVRESTLSQHKYVPSGIKSFPVTSDRFTQLQENKVPVDDIFFYRYFQQKAEREKKKADRDVDSDAESVGDDEFDDFLDKYEGQFDDKDLENLELDFATEFGKKKGKGKGDLDSDTDDEDDEDDGDLDDNLSDEEIDFDDDEFAKEFKDSIGDDFASDEEDDDFDDMEDGEQGFDEEDVEFSDNDEFAELVPKMKGKKRKGQDADTEFEPKKGRKGTSSSDLFAAAEEFANMMDENVGSKFDMIGSGALSNKDKADVKQLNWEVNRDKWIKGEGKNWRSKKGGNKFIKKNGPRKPKHSTFKKKQGKIK